MVYIFIIVSVLICVVAAFAFYWWRRKNQAAGESESAGKNGRDRDLVMDTLRSFQCEPTYELLANGVYDVVFDYQGARFAVLVDENIQDYNVLFAAWFRFDASNIELFGEVRDIVNNINTRMTPNVFYSQNENIVGLSTSYWLPSVNSESFALYLRTALNECFKVQTYFIDQLRR